MTVENAVLGTLMYSPQVRVLTDMPVIRKMAVQQAEARFDPYAFMESKFINTNDPVGSTLTTGGPAALLDRNWYYSAGLRSRTSFGSQVEVSQRVGYEDSNSIYFVPADQGTTRLALSFTQPLLNGAGRAYNTSMIVQADVDVHIALEQVSKDLQTLLLEVHRSYWDLYLQRAALLQKRKLYHQSVEIFKELNGRRDVDVLGNQIVRARAAITAHEVAIIRYEAAVHNGEAKLRSLISDPQLMAGQTCELIPFQRPSHDYFEPNLADALAKAMANRPEINQAMKEIRAASLRAEMAQNELLPVLNMIVETYVSGLRGSGMIGDAWLDQFDARRPSYSAGFQFEIPLGNRAANAHLLQRRLELRRAMNQLQAITVTIRAEVEVAVRDVCTNYREMVSRSYVAAADEAEIQGLSERWRLLPGDPAVAGVVLDQLLDAQDRLSNAEFEFTSAQVSYHVSLVNLNRVMGLLLAAERIVHTEGTQDGLPVMRLDKAQETPCAAVPTLPYRAEPGSTPTAVLDAADARGAGPRGPSGVAPLDTLPNVLPPSSSTLLESRLPPFMLNQQ
jgi:outer membrane protein TolC